MNKDQLADNIFRFIPILHRKLLRKRRHINIPKQQMGILHALKDSDGKAMKHYSKEMAVSKSNMTKNVNELIERGFITRGTDPKDRRIITLHMTKRGKEFLDKNYAEIKEQIIESISVLSDEDVKKANESFEIIRTIFEKLENKCG